MTFILVAVNVLLGGTVVFGLLQLLVHGIRADAVSRPQIAQRAERLESERLAA